MSAKTLRKEVSRDPGLRGSLLRIAVGGSLAMVYATGVDSPATTEFFRALGASEFHFGLIVGAPLAMLLFQFAGAAATNRIAHRKPVFMFLLIACRALFLVIALLPLARRPDGPGALVPALIALMVLSAALHNFAIPLWFSWMADLVPRPILNRFWGVRQRWMHVTWTASFLAVTAFLYLVRRPATVQFPILVAVAVAAGVIDILLFARVHEPPNVRIEGRRAADVLLEPLRHRDYRSFVLFSCYWHFATMFAAAFMQLYVLKELGASVWTTSLIWCLLGVGVAVTARFWGRIADRHGHRPVLKITVFCKPMIALVFLLLTPGNVLWMLPAAFLIDGVFNSGYMVAANGYMLTIAPRENRSMFVASTTGLSGLAAGLASLLAGSLLHVLEGQRLELLGRAWGPYHAVFALSLLMRVAGMVLVGRVREPKASRSLIALSDVLGQLPLRFLRFPVGLYRRPEPEDPAAAPPE